MAKKPNKKVVGPEQALAEKRIEAIKKEIATAMIHRNALPESATDEEKASAVTRVEQLQVQRQEAMRALLAIKREETTKVEQEHKEKKLRQKRLRASRQPGEHIAPDGDSAAPRRQSSDRHVIDRAAEEAQMDAANEEDLFFQRQQMEEEDREDAAELESLRRMADKKRKFEESTRQWEAVNREKMEAEAIAEAERLKLEKEAATKIRQQAALHRAEETKAKKREQRAEREAQKRDELDARSTGSFSDLLRRLKAFFFGPR